MDLTRNERGNMKLLNLKRRENMQCLMIFFTGQQNYVFNLVKVKCTGAVNVMQEDATVGKKLWYLDKILFFGVIPSTGCSWPLTSTSGISCLGCIKCYM